MQKEVTSVFVCAVCLAVTPEQTCLSWYFCSELTINFTFQSDWSPDDECLWGGHRGGQNTASSMQRFVCREWHKVRELLQSFKPLTLAINRGTRFNHWFIQHCLWMCWLFSSQEHVHLWLRVFKMTPKIRFNSDECDMNKTCLHFQSSVPPAESSIHRIQLSFYEEWSLQSWSDLLQKGTWIVVHTVRGWFYCAHEVIEHF